MSDPMKEFPKLRSSEQAKRAIERAFPDGCPTLSAYGIMANIEKTLADIELAKLQKQERLLRLKIMATELEAGKIKLAKLRSRAI